jgi:hypothetical protein
VLWVWITEGRQGVTNKKVIKKACVHKEHH